MLRSVKIILFFLCLTGISFAEDAQNVVPDTVDQRTATIQFNDEIRRTSRRLRELEGGVSLTSGVTGILPVANGGTGLDNSATAANSIPYFSSTGTMGNIGIGTTGYVLLAGSPPYWGENITSFTAGDYFLAGIPIVGMTTSGSATKVAEFKLNRPGTLRIKFYLSKNGGTTAYGQIYRNGSAVGTLQSTLTKASFSEDISGWSKDDLCQLYIYNSNAGNETYGVNLELYEGTPALTAFSDVTYPVSKRYLGANDPTTNLSTLGNIGDEYMRSSGGASTTLYVKTAATTWTAK